MHCSCLSHCVCRCVCLSVRVVAGEGALGGARELAAGDLAASANTETGFKQRKVNKRYKNYEMAGGAGEEDKADDEHKKAH